MASQNPGQAAVGVPAAPAAAQDIRVRLGDLPTRLPLIQKLQALRKSQVICYVTADRPDVSAGMGDDVLEIFFEHLEALGQQQRIDLFLYTRGGYTLAPTRLAYLIREYCKEFCVLVPRRAHSAGTSLAMAASEIVMHRMGELGPIDPTVSNQFNPEDPNDPDKKRLIPIPLRMLWTHVCSADLADMYLICQEGLCRNSRKFVGTSG